MEKKSKSAPKKKTNNLKTEKKSVSKNFKEKHSTLLIIAKILALLAWVASNILISQLIFLIIFLSLFGEFSEKPIIHFFYAIFYCSFSALTTFYFGKKIFKSKISLREELGLKGLPTFSDIALGPISFIVYLIITVILSAFFSLFPWFNASEPQNLGLSQYLDHSGLIFAYFSLAIICPIAEELIFRGWLYEKLRTTIPKKVSILFSIIISSLLFSIIHGQLNVAVNVFALGAIACLLREITGSVYAGIFLHIIKNTLAFLLVYVYHIS